MNAPVTPYSVRSPFPVRRSSVDAEQWLAEARKVRDARGLLLTLFASDERDKGAGYLVRALLQDDEGVLLLELPVGIDRPGYPGLSALFPCADRMQRAVYDLMGIEADGADHRRWLRHASWPDVFPLRRDFSGAPQVPCETESYPFVRVEGEGVHEIAVGPVHAGIIEPGHFRLSVVGEKLLRLEERFGFTHKGIEKRFEQFAIMEGHRLAARVSGDSAVAYSWAYCMALEALCDATPPPRALALRAFALERERIANHVGDLGALGGDAGFTVGVAQFSRLKEEFLRLNASAFDARYLFDEVIPGGVVHDLTEDCAARLIDQLSRLERELTELRSVYDEHAGVQDRFVGTGRVTPELAVVLGLVGLAGRASGQARDVRCDFPMAPYGRLQVRKIVRDDGDVAARVAVRFDETFESIRVCRQLLSDLPEGATRRELPPAPERSLGIGIVEAWRGPVLLTLEAGPGGGIRRCHPHDPSWQNWPVIEHAVMDNIVPDFPLINKSFNLAYSGHDL